MDHYVSFCCSNQTKNMLLLHLLIMMNTYIASDSLLKSKSKS